MKKHVIIFEARGGLDKGEYGIRKDSKSIIDALKKRGWSSEIIFYNDEDRGEIYRYTIDNADAYISRVDPGNLVNETCYFQMLRELVNHGVTGLPHPDAMIAYGAKNSIEKLKGSIIVPEDVYTYYHFETLKEEFPKRLKNGIRVLKQNRGTSGEGIWKVEVIDFIRYQGDIPLNAKLRLTEAKDNHTEYKTLQEFLEFCIPYFEGKNGMLLDMPFFERIVEGEIRALMLRDHILKILHKQPANRQGAFSATFLSGAKYRYDTLEEWPDFVLTVKKSLKTIRERLGNYNLPLLWTADFILDTDENGNDKYVLGEINASCIGFAEHLELSENIANEVLDLLDKEDHLN